MKNSKIGFADESSLSLRTRSKSCKVFARGSFTYYFDIFSTAGVPAYTQKGKTGMLPIVQTASAENTRKSPGQANSKLACREHCTNDEPQSAYFRNHGNRTNYNTEKSPIG